MSKSGINIDGYVQKKSNNHNYFSSLIKTYKKRYFVLDLNKLLFYYKKS